ncbi:MAG TPA: hypothetical protein VGO25_08860 [Rhodanobacteraceae bacterium]|nr:hypothetical protein [Rhodanobacteraceae bacterium]
MSVGFWQPLWLGTPTRQCYAALHPAAGARVGVVMAPPLLHEQPRSRRVLVEVASRLNERGLPCLRFDYFGTGDSGGEGERHDFDAVHSDLDLAVRALRDTSGVDAVVLMAWRGAALPAWSWPDARRNINALALWEPVLDGSTWLAALEAVDRTERQARYPNLDTVQDSHLMGFPTAARWRADMAAARIASPAPAPAPAWMIARNESDDIVVQRRFSLPDDAPRFDDGIGIERAMFLSRKLYGVVDEIAQACLALGA